MRKPRDYWCIVCWGPIETLSNGYFIRVYTLAENITKYLHAPIIIAEYSEKLSKEQVYGLRKINKGIVKTLLPGNEKRGNMIYKYIRFSLYQLVNTIKLQEVLKCTKAVIIGGELFLPTLLALKITVKKHLRPFVLADPQMLISEREKRCGRKFMALLLFVLEMLFFKLSDFIIAISERMKELIANDFKTPQERIVVIPHILPGKYRTPIKCPRKRDGTLGNVHDVIKLIFVGSLHARQNIDATLYLIRILSLLRKYIVKPVILYIVGSVDGKTKRVLERLILNYGLEEVAKILGYVKDLDDFICENADVLLAPMFTMSGVSTKMLYYLRFREKTIIASREAIEGIEQFVATHGKVVIAEDPKDFAMKLLEVVNNA